MADKFTLPPPSQPFPGSTTPGWNDPPPSSATVATTPRTRLNKRVAFPLQGTVSGEAANKPTAIVPPSQIGMTPPPPPPATNSNVAVVHPMGSQPPTHPSAATPAASLALPDDAVDSSMRVLRDKCGNVQESLNVRRDEIAKRLGLIEQSWRANNLSAPVKEKLFRISLALNESKFNEAMDVYMSLVTGHSTETAMWLVAVRHVILTTQPASEEPPSDAAAVASIPAMYVPAMPRQACPAEETDNATPQPVPGRSAVQHI